jgi:uncharacterized protein YyaL (SSP411 family)
MAMSRGNEPAREAFTTTLEKMARGGVYDQLAGGFHRYSVDERWIVPHFEKMLYDNTELLRNYVHGFQSFVREDFLETAREIVAWLDSTMTDRERGGFFASQDADVGLDDDGDYFTWTLEEARAVLDPAELEFAAKYWDIGELGEMHHNPAKNVLHVKQSLAEMVKESGASFESLLALRDSARAKLLAARALRPTPFIDRTLYTGWNAMAVTAYLEAARVLRMDSQKNLRCSLSIAFSKKPGTGNRRSTTSSPTPTARSRRLPPKKSPAHSTTMRLPSTPASTHGWPAAK